MNAAMIYLKLAMGPGNPVMRIAMGMDHNFAFAEFRTQEASYLKEGSSFSIFSCGGLPEINISKEVIITQRLSRTGTAIFILATAIQTVTCVLVVFKVMGSNPSISTCDKVKRPTEKSPLRWGNEPKQQVRSSCEEESL